MLAKVVDDLTVFANLGRQLLHVGALYGKLPEHLVVFFGEYKSVGIDRDHIAPQKISNRDHKDQAAPFRKPAAENGLIVRQDTIPKEENAIREGSIKERSSGRCFPFKQEP